MHTHDEVADRTHRYRSAAARRFAAVVVLGWLAAAVGGVSVMIAFAVLANALDAISANSNRGVPLLTTSAALFVLALAASSLQRLALDGVGTRAARAIRGAVFDHIARTAPRAQEVLAVPARDTLGWHARTVGVAFTAVGRTVNAAVTGLTALLLLLGVGVWSALVGLVTWTVGSGIAVLVAGRAARSTVTETSTAATEWSSPLPDSERLTDPQLLSEHASTPVGLATLHHRDVVDPLLGTLTVLVALAALWWLSVTATASAGIVFVVAAAFSALWRTAVAFGVAATGFGHARAAERALDTALNLPTTVTDRIDAAPIELRGSLAVTMHAPADTPDEPGFEQRTLSAAPGEVVGVLGPPGPEMVTLACLPGRLVEGTGHSVLLDDRDVESLRLMDVRRQVALVPARPQLLQGTVLDNIAAGCPAEIPAEQLDEAAETVGLNRIVADLPEGYHTIVDTERWPDGPRLLLGLARALARDPAIIVLYYPRTDEEVGAASLTWTIDRLRGSRTVLVFTDRLALLRSTDLVYRSDGGSAATAHTYSELLHGVLETELGIHR